MKWHVAVSAHRGGTEEHPPGTWEAYLSALAAGAEYVEFDVRKLGDGTLVCYHDPRAGPDGPPLAYLPYDHLCRLVGYQVPTVPDLLAALAGRAAAHVDLKEPGYEAEVMRLAIDTLGEDSVVATTLEDESVARISTAFPRVRTALSLGRGRAEMSRWQVPGTRLRELFPLRRIRACGADWVAVDKTLARYGVLRQCARHGIGAMVWTVDDGTLIDRFLQDRRVDVLVTNRPRFALQRRALLRSSRAAPDQSVPGEVQET